MVYKTDGLTSMIADTLRLTGIVIFGAWNEKYKQPKFIENGAQEDIYQRLLSMVDHGKVNEAENEIMEQIDIDSSMENLEMGLCIYGYINDKDDQFLDDHEYSRAEIEDGIQNLLRLYGYDALGSTMKHTD